jgi:hypothetical protein
VPTALFSYRRFIGPGCYGQTNLSQTRLANIITRRHILYALLERKQMPEFFGDFVHSLKFRERFLYNSIVIDPDATEETLGQLDLSPVHLKEASAYWHAYRKSWFRHWLLLRRIRAYAGYFGVSGLQESLKVFRQHRAYRRIIARA